MGAITFTNLIVGQSDGNKRWVAGNYTFSTTYTAGGDTFDPLDIGLQEIDVMICAAALDVGNSTVNVAVVTPQTPITSTKVAGGSPPGKISAYAVPAEAGNGDMSSFTGTFYAVGS